jgi:hypothetical protein
MAVVALDRLRFQVATSTYGQRAPHGIAAAAARAEDALAVKLGLGAAGVAAEYSAARGRPAPRS